MLKGCSLSTNYKFPFSKLDYNLKPCTWSEGSACRYAEFGASGCCTLIASTTRWSSGLNGQYSSTWSSGLISFISFLVWSLANKSVYFNSYLISNGALKCFCRISYSLISILHIGHLGILFLFFCSAIQCSRQSVWKPWPCLSSKQDTTETSQPSTKSIRQIEHSV